MDTLNDSASRRLEVIGRRSRLMIWVAAVIAGLGGAFVVGLPDVYRSSALVLVQGQLPEVVTASSSTMGIDARLQTIKQEAFSRARLTDLLQQFHLYGVSASQASVERGLERLQRDVRVEPTSTDQTARGGSQTLAFRVSYLGSDPQTAADVANALAAFFVAQNDRMRTEQASQATEFLKAQLEDTRGRLSQQEARVKAFNSRNTGALPQQTEANIAAINRLDSQLRLNDAEQLKLIERRQSLQNDLAKLEVQAPPQADASPSAQVARLEAELADLRTRFGETYPDVKAARTRLAELKGNLGPSTSASGTRPGSSQSAVLRQALEEVDQQIARLETEDRAVQARISSYEGRLERAPAQAPEFEGLMRDYQATRDHVDALQKRHDEATLVERAERGREAQEFRILDAALPPSAPAGPSRGILLVLVLMAAVIGSAALVLAIDQLDSSFHTVDDLRRFTRVPVLASIPEIPAGPRVTHSIRTFAVTSAALVALAALAGGAFVMAQASEQVSRLLSRVL